MEPRRLFQPIEGFDGRRHRDEHGGDGECRAQGEIHATDKHVVTQTMKPRKAMATMA